MAPKPSEVGILPMDTFPVIANPLHNL